MSTVVRRARPEDAAAVADVFVAARAPMTYASVAHPEEDVRREFGGIVIGRDEVWVAEQDGRVVAFAALSDDELEHLYVDPHAQSRGIGGELLALAKERRPDGFRFWVFQQNTGARRFYGRHGCTLVRETDGAQNEERAPDALYEWRPDAVTA
jgi:ribosomal protein S18 acetylase RimI-like enzyme